MQQLHILDINQLSEILGRAPQTIRNDMCRNPKAVPPRIAIPGTRLCRWSLENVEAWIRANSAAMGVAPLDMPGSLTIIKRKRGRPPKCAPK